MKPFSLLTLGVFCLCLTGCGQGEYVKRAGISGEVSFDGEPVESGVILFIPEQGVVGPPVQIAISGGSYSAPVATGPTVGKNQVQILANRSTNKEVLVQGVKTTEILQYIPAKFNEQTTLSAEIVVGSNQVDFHLGK